jgi:chlorite dismutase
MLSPNTQLDLLQALIEEVRQNSAIQRSLIEEVQRHSANQDRLIEAMQRYSITHSKHDNRLCELERKYEEMKEVKQMVHSLQAQLEECQESANYAVGEVRHLTHLVSEKEELENRVAFYCPPD